MRRLPTATEDLKADLDLARRAESGEADAWSLIVRRTQRALFLFLLSRVRFPEDARDLLQDTYLLAVRHLGQYRGEATLLAWMRSIARRRFCDWARSERAHTREIARGDDLFARSAMVAPDPGAEAERARLERAMARLPATQRSALILHSVCGFSHREVAKSLGCSEGTARIYLLRARRRMRKFLVR